MKAMVQDRFGPPDVLRLGDTGLPELGAGDVLVRVPPPRSTRPIGTSCGGTRWSRG
jgi:hypothetical protein